MWCRRPARPDNSPTERHRWPSPGSVRRKRGARPSKPLNAGKLLLGRGPSLKHGSVPPSADEQSSLRTASLKGNAALARSGADGECSNNVDYSEQESKQLASKQVSISL